MRFIVKGRIKPAVRMTQRGKWNDPQAHEYLSCKAGIGLQIKAQMRQAGLEMIPPKTPMGIIISFQCANGLHRSDLDNMGKTVTDAMQGIVYKNDCWIDRLILNRKLGDDDMMVIEVWRLT